MKALQKGFTLIELMIVIAIISILATIALPAYQEYLIRAKVSEALLALSSTRAAIAEGYVSMGIMVTSNASMGVPNQHSKWIDAVDYAGDGANIGVAGVRLANAPELGGAAYKILLLGAEGNPTTGAVAFTCFSWTVPVIYLPSSCRKSVPSYFLGIIGP